MYTFVSNCVYTHILSDCVNAVSANVSGTLNGKNAKRGTHSCNACPIECNFSPIHLLNVYYFFFLNDRTQTPADPQNI